MNKCILINFFLLLFLTFFNSFPALPSFFTSKLSDSTFQISGTGLNIGFLALIGGVSLGGYALYQAGYKKGFKAGKNNADNILGQTYGEKDLHNSFQKGAGRENERIREGINELLPEDSADSGVFLANIKEELKKKYIFHGKRVLSKEVSEILWA
jgi:hypothetical protein